MAARSVAAEVNRLPRLAIVNAGTSPELSAFADLLSAELSKSVDKCELVERGDLKMLEREAAVQQLEEGARPLALARLAKADALVFVDRDPSDPQRPQWILRLSDCSQGLIRRSWALPADLRDCADAARLSAAGIALAAGNIPGSGDSPVTLSLLGLRSITEPRDSFAVTLNTAVAHKLTGQPDVTVTERWKLDDVVFERSLAARDLPALSTASLLLDGSFAVQENQVKVSLRLQGKAIDGEQTLVVTGETGAPSTLADEIVRAILARLNGKSVRPFDAAEEARHFAELGNWLLHRKMGVEAAQALESAVALGNDSIQCRLDRLAAYATIICPREDKLNTYSPQRLDVDGLETLDDEDFAVAIGAMGRFATQLRDLVADDWKGWEQAGFTRANLSFFHRAGLSLGEEVLQAVLARQGRFRHAMEARRLRSVLRDLANEGVGRYGTSWIAEDVHFQFICETPEAALADYRSRLDPAKLSHDEGNPARDFRSNLWATEALPRLVDWESDDLRAVEVLWQRLIAEMSQSRELVPQLDALAFAFQARCDDQGRSQILRQYHELVGKRIEEVATSPGQLAFAAFKPNWALNHPGLRDEHLMQTLDLLGKVVARADWVESITMDAVYTAVLACSVDDESSAFVERLLNELDALEARAPESVRWRSVDQGEFRRDMDRIRETAFKTYPKLAALRLKQSSSTGSAVPLRSWQAPVSIQEKSFSDEEKWIRGDHLGWDGNKLLVPLVGPYLVVLDPRLLTSEVHPLPKIVRSRTWSMDARNGELMIYTGDGLYLGNYQRGTPVWKKIDLPLGDANPSLDWQVMAYRGDFYLGSVPPYKPENPQHLLAKYAHSRWDWIVSSNRRPATHPMDGKRPRSFLRLFDGYGMRPTLFVELVENGPWTQQTFELESGNYLGDLGACGQLQRTGDRLLHWHSYKGELLHVLAFDPDHEKPLLLLRNGKPLSGISPLGDGWEKAPARLDYGRPEFQGGFIAPVGYAGRLWILKWDERGAAAVQRSPESLRLVCVDLDAGKSVTIPLRYAVSEAWRSIRGDDGVDMNRPHLNGSSLVATPAGLFIATCNDAGPHQWNHAFSPGLLYLRWDEINAWLTLNQPGF
jgi:hypothetical protein